jgi:nucleoside-diphosphate-sugar epimerase
MAKVFLTGCDGYIGTLLAGVLMERGHEVTGCDTGFHRIGWLYNGVGTLPRVLVRDIRRLEAADLAGHDAVVHLAELSNDPVGELAPHITYAINHQGSVRLARLAREAGITRFIYFSSCSVYGASADKAQDERGDTQPLTAYAECKLLVERDVGAMASDDFSPTFLRNATAYGASPRQRFDLVVNNLSGLAWCHREIRMDSDGTPWRPLVHVLDICQAAACALEAPREAVHGETFNVGANGENYQVRDIATIVGETFPGCTVSFGQRGGDQRDYKVNFDKIAARLPGFAPRWNVRRGAEQLLQVFERIRMPRDLFESRAHTRLKQIHYLIDTGQIDQDFFWRE